MRIIAAAFIAFILISQSGCKKNRGVDEYDESDLYGTWVKGSNFGDTLWFMKKNGQFVMRIATSFNSSMPGYVEKRIPPQGWNIKYKILCSCIPGVFFNQ